MIIRPAHPSDAGALARVHVASWRAAYASILPAPVLAGLSEEEFEVRWRGYLLKKQPINLVWEANGSIGGFVTYGDSRDGETLPEWGEVYSLYLHPDCWGQGGGRALMEAAQQAMAQLYLHSALWVLQDNLQARAFYERIGFQMDGQVKNIELRGVTLPEVRYVQTF